MSDRLPNAPLRISVNVDPRPDGSRDFAFEVSRPAQAIEVAVILLGVVEKLTGVRVDSYLDLVAQVHRVAAREGSGN